MPHSIPLNDDQRAMFRGQYGLAKQMAMRLLLDMAAAAGARELVPITSAHLSGVSPLTGGLGLRQFLSRLAADPQARVAVPTTLNSAGCDEKQFTAMRITAPDFLEHNHQIVAHYTSLGVQPTQSCIPYEWEGVVTTGTAAWAESNAICFGNSYCGLQTNRESGLSALACALTGYAPLYGLLQPEARAPNLAVTVSAPLDDPTDLSILGDWIGKQRQRHWRMPYGPIPLLSGLPPDLTDRGSVLIRGKRCPIRGRVCMDQMMVDVTDLDQVEIGDEVVLLGTQGDQEISHLEWTAIVGGYNNHIVIRCVVTKRVPRVYFYNGKKAGVKVPLRPELDEEIQF